MAPGADADPAGAPIPASPFTLSNIHRPPPITMSRNITKRIAPTQTIGEVSSTGLPVNGLVALYFAMNLNTIMQYIKK